MHIKAADLALHGLELERLDDFSVALRVLVMLSDEGLEWDPAKATIEAYNAVVNDAGLGCVCLHEQHHQLEQTVHDRKEDRQQNRINELLALRIVELTGPVDGSQLDELDDGLHDTLIEELRDRSHSAEAINLQRLHIVYGFVEVLEEPLSCIWYGVAAETPNTQHVVEQLDDGQDDRKQQEHDV